MYSKKGTIQNPTGLHARPASVFVSAANAFASEITISKLDESGAVVKSCPAKSIVLLLTMALSQGTNIELSAEGADEKRAVDTLTELLVNGLLE